ncbi:hypothetical protein M9458_041569, partial [Cirrhinus mrigala]
IGSSRSRPSVSFGTPEEDRMSIATSEERLTPDEADDFAEQPPFAEKEKHAGEACRH